MGIEIIKTSRYSTLKKEERKYFSFKEIHINIKNGMILIIKRIIDLFF